MHIVVYFGRWILTKGALGKKNGEKAIPQWGIKGHMFYPKMS